MSRIPLESQKEPIFNSEYFENRKYAEKCWDDYPDKPYCLRVIFYEKYMLIGVQYPGEYPKGNEYCLIEYNEIKQQFSANCTAAFRMMWERAKLADFSKKSF